MTKLKAIEQALYRDVKNFRKGMYASKLSGLVWFEGDLPNDIEGIGRVDVVANIQFEPVDVSRVDLYKKNRSFRYLEEEARLMEKPAWVDEQASLSMTVRQLLHARSRGLYECSKKGMDKRWEFIKDYYPELSEEEQRVLGQTLIGYMLLEEETGNNVPSPKKVKRFSKKARKYLAELSW